MKIKEVEELLSISRSNIRFYEKEGLLKVERQNNNYREYNEKDIEMLKKILILRKLGFTIEEIKDLQEEKSDFHIVTRANVERLEKQIECLKGALEINKSLLKNNISYKEINQEELWDEIIKVENKGQKFVDICKDYLNFEKEMFSSTLKYFGFNFKKINKKYGLIFALILLFSFLTIRGIVQMTLWDKTFVEGFGSPLLIFIIASIIVTPIFLINKKHPKVASIISGLLLVLIVLFLALIVLTLLIGLFATIFS
ncbi:MAG: MerR family transcriptional regulator [Bacilli bacterium]|nr:MerR family transcriptional regulator [Bacilli bacterium]